MDEIGSIRSTLQWVSEREIEKSRLHPPQKLIHSNNGNRPTSAGVANFNLENVSNLSMMQRTLIHCSSAKLKIVHANLVVFLIVAVTIAVTVYWMGFPVRQFLSLKRMEVVNIRVKIEGLCWILLNHYFNSKNSKY